MYSLITGVGGGLETVVEEVRKVLNGRKLGYIFDAISEKQSHHNFAKLLDPWAGKVSFVLIGHREDIPDGIEHSTIMAGSLWKELAPLGVGEIGNWHW